MDYIEECLEKFNKLPQEIQDFLNSEKVVKTLESIEEKYNIDLTLALVLIFINELDLEDLGIYIEERFKIEENLVDQILIKLEDNIFKEVAKSFSDLEEQPISDYLLDISYEDKKKIISEIFYEKLLEQFNLPEDHLLRLNAVIFELIGKNEQFLNKLIKYFLDNQERFSSKNLIIKGKEVEPTIANWIKDFVDLNGSDIFSSVVLAKYLITSENVKKLKEEERQMLRQVLKIYKNLVFFPESMGSAKYLDWEIFPINRDLLNIFKNNFNKKTDLSDNPAENKEDRNSQDNKKIVLEDKPIIKKESIKEIKVEKKEDLKTEKIEKDIEDPEITKLREMLAKYPENSLERKAIESEIKKISNKQAK